ncbi:collagenase [Microbulbifer aggregans]|uniref:collagenase n=1 Tax=Microbulbifer aggregans TaxID=1769779 RepID=UPI001CFEEEF8|nr:collagenase [Microbulbifer aggregans]
MPSKRLSVIVSFVLTCVLQTSCDTQKEHDAFLAQIANDETELWKIGEAHTPSNLRKVLISLDRQLSRDTPDFQTVDRSLYYLRAYSYFGPQDSIDHLNWMALDKVVSKLRQHAMFTALNDQAARLHEHFAVTLYRYYNHSPLDANLSSQLPALFAVLNRMQDKVLSEAEKYALWESFRALGFLGYEARSNSVISEALTASGFSEKALLNFARSTNAFIEGQDWPLSHSLWALGNLQLLQKEEDAAKALDDTVWKLLTRDLPQLSDNDSQKLYTRPYLVTSFRGKSACENEFTGRCVFPSDTEALPIKHDCSATLYIRANSMSADALEAACRTLLAQEDDFHHKLASNRQPVANDHNDALEVVVFDNYSQYNQFASLLFDINTDNGGMFLEGSPEQPDNQARFIAFEAFWKDPDFSIWNLEHEYVHYLDGRFNKQGGFGYFPSHMVWWAEGLANYIAHGDHYDSAERDLRKIKPSDYPTLSDIFATEYKDGGTRVYTWSYLAIRFLYQQDSENLAKLAHHLRVDDFPGYQKQLEILAETLQPQFIEWLGQQAFALGAKDQSEKLPRKLYRYLYRDYLQPVRLTAGKDHRHLG